jgi:YbbR domain-containing protein
MAWKPFRNLGLKIAALGLGTLLWFTVTGHQIERRLYVPVLYSNLPESLVLTGEQMDGVSVYVRGDDHRVGALQDGDIRVLVGLEDGTIGENVIPLRPEDVVAPLGIEVLQVDPGTATVVLERSGSVGVAVRPAVEGQPIEGMRVSQIVVQPPTVVVEGPETRLRDGVTLVTRPINLTGRAGIFSEDVEVSVADPQLRVLPPRLVRVTVYIVPEGR